MVLGIWLLLAAAVIVRVPSYAVLSGINPPMIYDPSMLPGSAAGMGVSVDRAGIGEKGVGVLDDADCPQASEAAMRMEMLKRTWIFFMFFSLKV